MAKEAVELLALPRYRANLEVSFIIISANPLDRQDMTSVPGLSLRVKELAQLAFAPLRVT